MANFNNFDKIDYAQILFMHIERCAKAKTLGALKEFIESVDLLEALLPFCEKNRDYAGEIKDLAHLKAKYKGNTKGLPKKQMAAIETQKAQENMAYYFGKFRALMRYADKRGLLIFKVVNDFED